MNKNHLGLYLKSLILLPSLLGQINIFGQQPYIVSSEGYGKYGYLEKDATTYFRLNSNSHGSIYQLFSRTYLNSNNIITYGTAPNTCAQVEHSTNDYSFGANAIAGKIAYSSVHADYCGSTNSYGGNPNQTGYNERQHYILDVTEDPSHLSSSIAHTPTATNNVVLSIKIDFGSVSDRNLTRFWVKNSGTLPEGTNGIANDGVKIYYETATGSEVFNGTENSATLYGDYNSSSTSNNEYGHDALNINIPSGGLRVYVILNNFNGYNATSQTVAFSVINDGISFSPLMNTSFGLARINEIPSSPTPITKPASSSTVKFRSTVTGNWNSTSTWQSSYDGTNFNTSISFPSSSDGQVTIYNGHIITLNTTSSVSALTINSGGELTFSSTNTLTLSSGGTLTNNGTFTRGSGTVIFSGSGTITGTVNLNNVTISGAVNFGTNATIYGTLQINSGGSVATNAPTYATHSTLKYNTGGTYARSTEWYSSSGAGYPYNVTVANSTTLDYPNTAGAFTTNLGIAGSLSIENNCNFYMDFGAGAASGKLTVLGNIDIAGNLSLGDAVGGDLILYGNWTKTGGTFNSNSRMVEFTGTTNSTITNSAGETFSYLKINKTDATTNIVDITCNVTINNELILTDGLLALGTKHLTIASSATITGGSDGSYVNTNNTGTLRKVFSATGSFTFPVGYTNSVSLNFYDPITLNFTSGTFSGGAYAAVRAPNLKHSNNISTGHYLNRHWVVTQSGITSFNCNVTCVYSDYDIVGDEANIYCGKYNGSQWYLGSQANASTNTLTFNNNTSFSDFTGGELSAMPVHWLFHHCKPQNDKVQLSWGVSEEPSTGIYTIERSAEGSVWKALGTKTPTAPSFTSATYQFVDAAPLTQNFYRIKHTENNGEVQHSEICYAQLSTAEKPVIKTDAAGTEVVVTFELSGEQAGLLTLFDATGRKLKSSAMNGKTGRIQTAELPPGIYELLLEGPGIRHSQKVMIAR